MAMHKHSEQLISGKQSKNKQNNIAKTKTFDELLPADETKEDAMWDQSARPSAAQGGLQSKAIRP